MTQERWIKLADNQPAPSSKWKRYMVYSPQYGGYLFRCWYINGAFGSDEAQSIIDGVTHYRDPKRGEVDGQGSDADLSTIRS